MTWVMLAAGGLFGLGLVLILRGSVLASPPPLASVIADLRRPRELAPVHRRWPEVWADRLAGESVKRVEADLAVCERSTTQYLEQRVTWMMFGAAPGLVLVGLAASGVLAVPVGWALVGLVAGAVGGWFYSLADLRSDATKRRREFRHALSSYLELVTILIAGGAGVETALYDAASIGRGAAFRQLQSALSAAQARREAPWTTFGVLGRRLGVVELEELDASMSLAGEGAWVRESLTAKAEAMRTKDLAEIEYQAQARSETMVLPVAMMFAGFLLLIGFPALAGLSGP